MSGEDTTEIIEVHRGRITDLNTGDNEEVHFEDEDEVEPEEILRAMAMQQMMENAMIQEEEQMMEIWEQQQQEEHMMAIWEQQQQQHLQGCNIEHMLENRTEVHLEQDKERQLPQEHDRQEQREPEHEQQPNTGEKISTPLPATEFSHKRPSEMSSSRNIEVDGDKFILSVEGGGLENVKVQQKADEHQENVAQNESQGGDQVVDDHCYKILPAPKTKIMQDDADKQSEEVVDRRRKLEIAEHLYADPIPAPNVDTREEEAASGRAHDDNTSHVRGMLRRIVPDLLSGTEVNTTKTEHNHEATAMKTISAKHTPQTDAPTIVGGIPTGDEESIVPEVKATLPSPGYSVDENRILSPKYAPQTDAPTIVDGIPTGDEESIVPEVKATLPSPVHLAGENPIPSSSRLASIKASRIPRLRSSKTSLMSQKRSTDPFLDLVSYPQRMALSDVAASKSSSYISKSTSALPESLPKQDDPTDENLLLSALLLSSGVKPPRALRATVRRMTH